MQIDLFGSTEATAVHEAAPPVLTPHGAWVPPETIIFNAALKRGSLVNAIAILNGLKVNAVRAVLLASGFSLGDANNRAGMIAFVQSDIVAAARQKLTGAELHSFRSQAQKANGLVQSKNTLFNEPSRESETRENQDHGSSSQSTGLHTGPSPESRANGLDGSDHRQSVDDGLANSGASLDDGGHLSDQFASADRAGEGRTVGSDRHEPPVPSGNLGPARGPAGATSHRVNAGPATGDAVDYVASEGDRIGQGGLAQKFRDNVRALQLVRQLKSENRHAAGDELRTLARYVGWGGMKGVFDPANATWAKQHVELKGLLSPAEWAAASRSQLDAFYTDPKIIKPVYAVLERLGFNGGRTIDPSVGVGNFFGLMPTEMRNNSSLHGVELDILTSEIAAALYPSAKIAKATGFQNYKMASGYFDLVIGNPPFGSQAVADDAGSVFSGWSIHNYFFAKSIEMLRPGGIMSMVVSHNFLDKLDPHVRRWIARRADLVTGVRLPNTAFKGNANTEVITDILVFQRLDYENTLGSRASPDWLNTSDVVIENPKTGERAKIAINDYFVKNPDNVLGVNSTESSMYRANEYTVLANGDLEQQLDAWAQSVPTGIYKAIERSPEQQEAAVHIPEFVKEGSFFVTGEEIWQRLPDLLGVTRAQRWEPPNERALERMRAMIGIRDTLREQMRLERSQAGDVEIARGRQALNQTYDNFQKKFGFINDPVNRRLFLDDTESALIQALEFDYEKSISPAYAEEHGMEARPAKAVKADIFSRRVLFPPGEVEIVQTAKDALLHSLNYTGGVDMNYMCQAYGKESSEILAELGDLVFMDPVDGLVTADQYLSGDVKTKLGEVRQAAKLDTLMERNVAALEAVIPKDKLPSEIHAAIGAAWIPTQYYSAFTREVSGASPGYSYLASTGQWLTQDKSGVDFAKNNSEYGTSKLGALDIVGLLMNSRAPEVKKLVLVEGVERYVTDEEQTEAARQCADKIKAHWDSWIWADGDRAANLAGIYNERFNRTVGRKYDGRHLTLPGMNPSMALLAHQKNGVWRGLQDRVMLLDHVVGAGKTFECVAMVMEMRRLGIAKKPMLAVPNHLTLQWRSEFYRLYPGANVLAATPQDFERDNRERFFSKIVTGNWDAVIVGHSSLKKIAVPLEAEMLVVNEQLDDISSAVEAMKRERGDRNVIRDMEKIKANLEAKVTKLKEKSGTKDNVVDFADLGVDALVTDELHEFKNLYFHTQMNRVAGLGNPAGSGKAFDLFVKIRWLQNTYGDKAPVVGATGTPVSNSLSEMYTMQRYMQYPKMKANGLHVFDAWAKQYGDVQNVYEVAPSGTGYRLSQRFAKFKNLSSLMAEYRGFADVVTLKDLKEQEAALGKVFPVPTLLGGKPINVVVPRSLLQEQYFGIPEIERTKDGAIRFEVDLRAPVQIVQAEDGKYEMRQEIDGESRRAARRYDNAAEAAYGTALAAVTPLMHIDRNSIIGQFERLREITRATKGKVNALSLTGLANKAGLDYRLIDASAPDHPDSKVNVAIRNMLELGQQWEADKGVQLVFCDLSVPLSARAKMANKEKRIYVRDEAGALIHRKGTLHTSKAHGGLPYYLVHVGKGKDRTFSMYDPVSGHLMKDGLDNKLAAHEFIEQLLGKPGGPAVWLDMREQSRPIGSDEIDEYKSEQGLDADGDAADLEISAQDVVGVSGPAGFSIYDDMRAKLIAAGVPEHQIAFIHDYDTPQAKAMLFKNANAGVVRYLFGSTPKMGAGTNVQERIVGLHHIDAPYRPSDLEQREGRGIRRGNRLYERDPDGFRLAVYRYATAQTYDTRRWQLLEHKASGIEQLRNYTGVNEMEDVASEASNSADMKAAASGNPLILKETKLANEVKKLKLLERAHMDSQFTLHSRMNSNAKYAEHYGPHALASWVGLREQRNTAEMLGMYGTKVLVEKEDVMLALDEIGAHLRSSRSPKSLTYRGMRFGFRREDEQGAYAITMPDGDSRLMDTISRVGVVTRMENFANGIDGEILHIEKRIEKSALEASQIKLVIGQPFEQMAELKTALLEHVKVQTALRKSNSLAAVKPSEQREFAAAVASQKERLRSFGLGDAVAELEREETQAFAIETMVPQLTAGEPGIPVVEGAFHGRVLAVENGHVVQKVNRDGDTVIHSADALSLPVAVGQVVSIEYRNGWGSVVENGQTLALAH